jgi:hypothetical protein
MWGVFEFWRRISSTPMYVMNHILEFTTSFTFFTSVLHVDERFVLEEKGRRGKELHYVRNGMWERVCLQCFSTPLSGLGASVLQEPGASIFICN